MDRKELKQAGKALFKKNFWYSVLVAFLMAFTGTGSSPSFNFSFNVNIDADSGTQFETTNLEIIFDAFRDAFENFASEPFFIAFIIILLSVLVVACILGYFIFASFRCGGIRYFLKSRKNQPVEIKEVFENLRDKTNFNIARVTFFRDIHIFLWILVFMIPGVIKAFEYWAVDYILAVRPDIDKDEARRLSKILMDGNKWNLFVLELSFLGWSLLSIFTMGLLNIFFLNPYMQATFVEFFSKIRLDALAKGLITPNDIPDYEFIDPQIQFQQHSYQQPKNVVYRPDGMPVENTGYAQQPFQQSQNFVYKPDGTPVNNPYYNQSVQQPIQQPFSQPTNPVINEAIEYQPTETDTDN